MEAVDVLQKGMTLRVRISFLFAGVNYKAGDLFDYQRIGADWNRVRQLFDQRYIEIVPISSVVTSPVKNSKKEKIEEEEPVIESPKRVRRK
jgi:hypothetical protein